MPSKRCLVRGVWETDLDKTSELQLLLARQPIFDFNTEVVADELLFREFYPEKADVLDGDQATSAVLINAVTNLDLGQLVGSGQLGLVLKTVEAIQSGALDQIKLAELEPLGLSQKAVNEIYLSVIEWQSHLGDDLGLQSHAV